MPYRDQTLDNFEHLIAEMRAAIGILRQWSKYDPVIAGGALWSWAAYEPARDFDIFVHKTWFSRMKARNQLQAGEIQEFINDIKSDGYSLDVQTREVIRHRGKHVGSDKTIDLLLTPWKGINVVHHFDWNHCRVGFGLKEFTTYGAHYYAAGKLQRCFQGEERARSEATVRSKLHQSLWGKTLAHDRMDEVIATLNELLAEPQA